MLALAGRLQPTTLRTKPCEMSESDVKPADQPITIRVKSADEVEIKFKVRKLFVCGASGRSAGSALTHFARRVRHHILQVKMKTTFKKIFDAYYAQTGEPPNSVHFSYDGACLLLTVVRDGEGRGPAVALTPTRPDAHPSLAPPCPPCCAGKRVQEEDSPGSLKMDDNDVVDVVRVQTGGCGYGL